MPDPEPLLIDLRFADIFVELLDTDGNVQGSFTVKNGDTRPVKGKRSKYAPNLKFAFCIQAETPGRTTE